MPQMEFTRKQIAGEVKREHWRKDACSENSHRWWRTVCVTPLRNESLSADSGPVFFGRAEFCRGRTLPDVFHQSSAHSSMGTLFLYR